MKLQLAVLPAGRQTEFSVIGENHTFFNGACTVNVDKVDLSLQTGDAEYPTCGCFEYPFALHELYRGTNGFLGRKRSFHLLDLCPEGAVCSYRPASFEVGKGVKRFARLIKRQCKHSFLFQA